MAMNWAVLLIALCAISSVLASKIQMNGPIRITGSSCPNNVDAVFVADLTQPSEWNHFWENCVGSGHALLALRADWREHLKLVHDTLGIQRVRFHGLFDDDMSVLLGYDQNNNPIYSFYNIDSIFDFLVSLNMSPVVELSFMPALIASGNATVFHYKGNITPPKNYIDWYNLVQAVVQHLIDRYGIAEIRTWFFETWNEPNCGFWSGTQAEYFQLLQTTSSAIKDIDPTLLVGGPATCQSGWLNDTLKFVSENGVAIDFISTHEYPTDITPLQRDIMKQVMMNARNEVGKMPLLYTETNDGLYFDPPYHDTPFASAWAVFNFIDINTIPQPPELVSWWTFTDIFEEGGFLSEPYNTSTGWGLVNLYGIPKPVFRAYQLLHETGDTQFGVSGSHPTAGVLVTQNETHTQLLIYNHDLPLVPLDEVQVCVSITGLTPQNYESTLRRIDDDNCNPMATWVSQGSPEYPNQAQLEELLAASEFVSSSIENTVGNSDISFVVTIPAQGVAAITFPIA